MKAAQYIKLLNDTNVLNNTEHFQLSQQLRVKNAWKTTLSILSAPSVSIISLCGPIRDHEQENADETTSHLILYLICTFPGLRNNNVSRL